MGCRDVAKGAAAIQSLANEGVNTANAEVLELDIANSVSIDSAVSSVRSRFGSPCIDYLINNAGFAFKGSRFDHEVVTTSSAINYIGTRSVTERFLPLMNVNSSIINVSSVAGKRAMELMSAEKRAAFTDEANTVQQIDQMMEQFFAAVEKGSYKHEGWPEMGYGMSKAALSMWTRIMAKQLEASKQGITINACCPGFCKTAMSSFGGILTPDQGAATPMAIVKSQLEGKRVNGTFWANQQQAKWID